MAQQIAADNNKQMAPAGLKGVRVAETALGAVRGEEGFYHFRDFDATDLATSRTLEAIWYLQCRGSLPNASQEQRWRQEVGDLRVLDPHTLEMAADVGRNVAASHLGLISCLPLVLGRGTSWLDLSHEQFEAQLKRLVAAVPTLLGAVLAGQGEREPLNGDPSLSHAEDWVRMATGGRQPGPSQTEIMQTYLALTVDHGFNASTFAARVAASAGADATASLAAGVATLSGPLHGGAPSRALEMIDAIGEASNTEAWIRHRLETGEKIMGFGHAVYRAGDPRSRVLRDLAERSNLDAAFVGRAMEIEQRALAELKRHRPDSVIVTNVEFYAGVGMRLAGLPTDAFTPSFTVSRAIGWSAHVAEQVLKNKIYRPSAHYTGPTVRPLQPPLAS